MKKIVYISLLLTVVFSLESCKKEAPNLSKEASIPTVTLKGNGVLVWSYGTPFVEPGYSAKVDSTDISNKVKIKGYLDVNKMGKYTLKYMVKTADGAFASDDRIVIIPNPTASPLVSKEYVVDADKTYRVRNGTKTEYGDLNIYLYQTENDGEFYVSDFLGGYYDQKSGYGSAYRMSGYLKVNADNTLSLVSSSIPGWGRKLSDFSGTVSPDGSVAWKAVFAGMDFNLFLKK